MEPLNLNTVARPTGGVEAAVLRIAEGYTFPTDLVGVLKERVKLRAALYEIVDATGDTNLTDNERLDVIFNLAADALRG